jgi:hypothetical protein
VEENIVAIGVSSFAGQNWTIMPEALAVNEPKPASISAQKFVVVLTGVGIINLQGNKPNDWRRETVSIFPDIAAPLNFAINKYGIPRPVGLKTSPSITLEQWAPFAAVSSEFVAQLGGVNAGFAVDVWRPSPFFQTTDAAGQPVNNIFTGIDVDVAVRPNSATLHRVSYHITLTGRIVFLVTI